MDYGEILGTTWKTVWKHKVILGFGLATMIVPALLGMLMGGMFVFAQDPFEMVRFFGDEDIAVVLLIGGYFLFGVLSFVLNAAGTAGVMKGTLQADSGAESLPFIEIWDSTWPYVWRIMAYMFVLGTGMAVVFMVPALLGVLTAGLFFLCMLPLMVIMIPLAMMSYLFISLGMAVIVADDLGVIAAVKRTWETMRRNFWPLVLMTFLLYMAQIAVSMVMSLPMGLIQFLIFVPAVSNSDPEVFMRIFGIAIAILMPLSFLLQGLAMAYVNSGWMITYLRLKQKPEPASDIITAPEIS